MFSDQILPTILVLKLGAVAMLVIVLWLESHEMVMLTLLPPRIYRVVRDV